MGTLKNVIATDVSEDTFSSSQTGAISAHVAAVLEGDLPASPRSAEAVADALALVAIGVGALVLSVLIQFKRVPQDSNTTSGTLKYIPW